jgi:glycosyltransferase involved in cell wall biosynthesis
MFLKIANISLSDLSGGASVFSLRQHNSFLNHKIESKLFVIKKYTSAKSINNFVYINNLFFNFIKKINFFFLSNKNKYSFYNQGFYKINNIKQLSGLLNFQPSVIIFYTNSDLIHPKLLEKISREKKIIFLFYLMDYEFLTGGCHYAWNCNGYKSKCKNCPAVYFPLKNLPNKNFLEKKKYLKKILHYYVVGSKDFKLKVEKSSIFQKDSKVFLNYLGLDLKKFSIKNIKRDDQLSFCFRASLNPRKGQDIFIETIKYLKNNYPNFFNNVKFNIIGDSSICGFFDTLNIKYKFHNNVVSAEDLVNFYNSSDFMINYTIEDAGPMMINESLACGIPVISFRIGGAKEFILNNRNGFLVDKISHIDLARKLNFVKNISKKNILIMKLFSRKFALKKFNIDKNTSLLVNFIKTQLNKFKIEKKIN